MGMIRKLSHKIIFKLYYSEDICFLPLLTWRNVKILKNSFVNLIHVHLDILSKQLLSLNQW